MKTVVYVLKSMAMLAGTERVTSIKINWLASHGYKVVLVTYEQGSHPLAVPLHPDVTVIDLKVFMYKLSQLPLYLRIIKQYHMKRFLYQRFKDFVNNLHPDIISTTTYSIGIAKEIFKANQGAKLIIESHETCFTEVKEYSYQRHPIMRMVAKVYDWQNLRYVNRFDALVTLTNGDATEWKKHISTDIKVIPNPLTVFPDIAEKIEKPLFRILAVGRLEEVKGFDRLIHAFALIADKHPEWRIDIFGEGSRENELRALTEYYHLANRIGICSPTKEILSEYQKSDFYVLSSRHEGFGMVIIEAMSCGIPCVSFDCNYGPREIISDGIDGLLVEDGNIVKLSEAILWMMDHHNERLQMGRKARESVKKYQNDIIMQKWVSLFSQ